MKNAKERMDVIAAYRDVGADRGAAAICGITHKTVRRIIEAHEAATNGVVPARPVRPRNYEQVAELVAASVKKTEGRIDHCDMDAPRRISGQLGRAMELTEPGLDPAEPSAPLRGCATRRVRRGRPRHAALP